MNVWSLRLHTVIVPVVASMIALANCSGADDQLPWQRDSYDPDWSEIQPQRTIEVNYSQSASEQENGSILLRALQALRPGDRLEIGPGRYVVAPKITLDLQGTAEAPISIVAANPESPPTITRPDARQNLLNVGERRPCRYLALRHLELAGGSVVIRFYDCANVWLDQCELHHGQHGGVTVNSRDTNHMHITRNHFHHFLSGTGEGMYLGANHGKVIMSYSVIAKNHVHDCGGDQGDGIELKQGSYNNWIVDNHIHDTNYPCLITYGTAGEGINVVENNICYRSRDNTMQIQGEAIVRNNVVFAGRGAGFASTDHQGKTRDLKFIHNTIITSGRGVNLSSWNGRQGMVFANNAVYSQSGIAVRFPSGSEGVTVRGNVVFGSVEGVRSGYAKGRGLQDFQQATWNASRRNVAPSEGSALIGKADPQFILDQRRNVRAGKPAAGAQIAQ